MARHRTFDNCQIIASMKTVVGKHYSEIRVFTKKIPDTQVLSALPCFRCGICCHRYQPRIDLTEARTIADSLGIAWEQFAANYLDSRYFGGERFLLRQENGACIFLEQVDERVAKCKIHLFKPSACRDWTPSLFRKECQVGLARFWKLSVDQRGNLQGNSDDLLQFHSFVSSLC